MAFASSSLQVCNQQCSFFQRNQVSAIMAFMAARCRQRLQHFYCRTMVRLSRYQSTAGDEDEHQGTSASDGGAARQDTHKCQVGSSAHVLRSIQRRISYIRGWHPLLCRQRRLLRCRKSCVCAGVDPTASLRHSATTGSNFRACVRGTLRT